MDLDVGKKINKTKINYECLGLLIAIVLITIIPLIFTSRYIINLLILASALGISALGLTVSLGYTGQLSLAQAVFYGIGAYAVALGTTKWGLSWWTSLILGLLLAAIIGAFLGVTTLKVGGRYLAMVTICVQVVFALVLSNWIEVTGGPDGISGISRPSFIFKLDTAQKYAWFSFSVLLIVTIFVHKLKKSKLGRSMRSVRDNEMAAEALGVDSLKIKVIAFVICAVFGALGGSIYASGFSYISPDSFVYQNSVEFIVMVLVGGSESALGTVFGALVFTILPEMLRDLKDLYLVIYGAIIVIVTIFMPSGFAGIAERLLGKFIEPNKLPPATHSLEISDIEDIEVLSIENVAKYFGGLKALDGVDLKINKGDFHGLIGPNGSGKTTLINVVSGVYNPTYGKVIFLGKDISGGKQNKIAELGLVRTFQNLRLFGTLSVWENVLVGSQRAGGNNLEIQDRAMAAIEFVGIEDIIQEKCRNLPYGHRKLVELARSLASKPKILLLDEPAAGLNESEKEQLAEILKKVHNMGLTIMLVEHDMSIVKQLSSELTVLNFGKKICNGCCETVLNDPLVVEAYLGNTEVDLYD
jgi:branched-chain amino acid transport system permease protein